MAHNFLFRLIIVKSQKLLWGTIRGKKIKINDNFAQKYYFRSKNVDRNDKSVYFGEENR